MFLYFFFGLIGLSIVVFVHELGHFIAARLCKVEVEAFALGWGKVLWRWKPRNTEYRLCLFPLGGYCKMKGEDFIIKSIENPDQEQVPEKGSLFSVSAFKRIIISAAGPLFNLIFAVLVLFTLYLNGAEQSSVPAKIILASEIDGRDKSVLAAEQAGLKTGDMVTKISDSPITNYQDLQEAVFKAGKGSLNFTVLRDNQTLSLTVSPQWMEKEQRAFIGVYAWVDPVIKVVAPQSSAAIAGLKEGDLITSVNGKPVRNTLDIAQLQNVKMPSITYGYLRGGQSAEVTLVPDIVEGKMSLGIEYAQKKYPGRPLPLPQALPKAWDQTTTILSSTVTGLTQLITGKLNVSEGLSGPLRTTYFIGEVTSKSFLSGWGEGVAAVANLLSFISIVLFFMNLLPIPALDGGSIVLSAVEGIRRKKVKIKTFIRYQQIGFGFILLLILFVTINDVIHFLPK